MILGRREIERDGWWLGRSRRWWTLYIVWLVVWAAIGFGLTYLIFARMGFV